MSIACPYCKAGLSPKGLKPGKYLLTFRLLRHGQVTAISKSIPFRVRR